MPTRLPLPTVGHAGESGVLPFLPHEILGGIVALVAVGFVLIVLSGVIIWLLVRIDRRLRRPD